MSRILIGPAIGEAFGLIFADVARFFALGGSWLLAVAALLMLTTLALIGWPEFVAVPALAAIACFLAGAVSFAVMALRVVMRRPVTPPGLTLRFAARERRFARHAGLVGCQSDGRRKECGGGKRTDHDRLLSADGCR